jgi:hypothetical protein
MAETTIPVTVAEDAAARVAQLGMQREFEQLIEHAKQVMPNLREIRVVLEYDPVYPSEDPAVLILAHRDEPAEATADRSDWDYSGWKVRTFPPEVCTQFVVMSTFGGSDGW